MDLWKLAPVLTLLHMDQHIRSDYTMYIHLMFSLDGSPMMHSKIDEFLNTLLTVHESPMPIQRLNTIKHRCRVSVSLPDVLRHRCLH
jgi:hypothetical protein